MVENTIVKNIEKRMEQMGLTQEETAYIMKIGRTTFRRRLKHPEEFTLEELTALCRYCGIGLRELMK